MESESVCVDSQAEFPDAEITTEETPLSENQSEETESKSASENLQAESPDADITAEEISLSENQPEEMENKSFGENLQAESPGAEVTTEEISLSENQSEEMESKSVGEDSKAKFVNAEITPEEISVPENQPEEMESRSVCEESQAISLDAEITSREISLSESDSDVWQIAPTHVEYAPKEPRKPLNRRLLLLSICSGIITLLCLSIVFFLFFWQRSELLNEIKDMKAHVDALQEPVKVAFSASYRKGENFTLGPFPEFQILVFRNIFTNIGGAYNTSTGIFTVPVKGVYRFYFTAFGWSECTGVLLHLNEDYLMGNYDNSPGQGRGATNVISLELEVGQMIYVGLSKGRQIHISPGNHNLFSGHLLFPIRN